MKASITGISTILVATILSACGGGGDNPPRPAGFSIGGTVSGLPDGAQLSLLDNGSSSQAISANGLFTLTATLSAGSAYSISISTSPAGYKCDVTHGSGTMPASNVTDVAVACTQITATVGGSVEGLISNGLVLANGDDTLTVSADAKTFTMPAAVASGATYHITVRRTPTAMHCSVSNASGTGSDSPVTDVGVSCEAGRFSELYSFGDESQGAAPLFGLIQGSDGNFYSTTSTGGANDAGTVFKLTPDGAQTVLWSFGAGSDGSQPLSSLLQASDGDLYGTTAEGGAYGSGTVFRISLGGSESVLWSFGEASDGARPSGNLIEGRDGDIYGMTEYGGTEGGGTVFRLTPSGAETVMLSFGRFNGGPSEPQFNGLTQDSDGTLYGLTAGGGTNSEGAIFKLSPDGAVTTLYSFHQRDIGAFPTDSLVKASDGNFYGMTLAGGTNNRGVLFQMSPSGAVSILHAFGAQGDGRGPNGGLMQATDGNFYGVTCFPGSSGTVFQFTLSGTETPLYSFPGAVSSGACPTGNLIEGTDGGLYGTTTYGGASGNGSVYRIN